MGILDSKTRILDIQLTDIGRKQLSQGLLNFTYYAFGDQEIDYSGSLVFSTTLASASLDEFVRRGFSLEADQRKNGLINSTQNLNLNSFLYTVPAGSNVLPNFYVSVTGSASLQRQYSVNSLSNLYLNPTTMVGPLAVIARATIAMETYQDKVIGHVFEQNLRLVASLLLKGQSITGIPISKDFISLDSRRGLNTNNGTIVDISSLINYYIFISSLGSTTQNSAPVNAPVASSQRTGFSASSVVPPGGTANAPIGSSGRGVQSQFPTSINTISVNDQLEFVSGLDSIKIDFALKTNNLVINSKSGYLIEIFNSASDGTLLKMTKDDIVDPISNQKTQLGFSSILSLLVDQ